MKRVLLATDFSNNAHRATDYALLLFKDEGLEFLLLHTVDLIRNIPEMLISVEDILQEQSQRALQATIDRLKLQHQDVPMEYLSTYGSPISVVKKVIQQKEIDLVVMGSKGISALNEVFLGSTASKFINILTKPVLVVPSEYELKPPKRIVFGTDLTQVDQLDTLNPMIQLAKKYEAEIVILNVTGSENDSKVRNALSNLDFNKHFSNVNYRFDVSHSPLVLEGILTYLNEYTADMLVLLPKQNPVFEKLLTNRLSDQMALRTTVPLLLV